MLSEQRRSPTMRPTRSKTRCLHATAYPVTFRDPTVPTFANSRASFHRGVSSALIGTYAWLKSADTALGVAYGTSVLKAEADAAVIPSIVAQAMQHVFRYRAPATRARPLEDAGDYEALRSWLASGEAVAKTYYGSVAFDSFGNNAGFTQRPHSPHCICVFFSRWFVRALLSVTVCREQHGARGNELPDGRERYHSCHLS